MVQGFGGGGRQRVHIRNVHSLMSLLPLCYSTHKSSFCEEERVQRWPSFSLSSSTGGENGCVPKDFNQKHAGCRETSGVFCCERGAGCRVRGSGFRIVVAASPRSRAQVAAVLAFVISHATFLAAQDDETRRCPIKNHSRPFPWKGQASEARLG